MQGLRQESVGQELKRRGHEQLEPASEVRRGVPPPCLTRCLARDVTGCLARDVTGRLARCGTCMVEVADPSHPAALPRGSAIRSSDNAPFLPRSPATMGRALKRQHLLCQDILVSSAHRAADLKARTCIGQVHSRQLDSDRCHIREAGSSGISAAG